MDENLEREGLRHIEHIEHELKEIRERTPTPPRAFLYGLLQGVGWILGSLLALALIGWLLSVFGLIPGLDVLARYLSQYTSSLKIK